MTDISLFEYDLPEKLIAQYPPEERDSSRLLVADRAAGNIEHRRFSDLPEYLREGDVLVFNDSRVIKARLTGIKEGTGAQIELLLTREIEENNVNGKLWEALARPAKRLRPGDRLRFGEGFAANVEDKGEDGLISVRFDRDEDFWDELERFGHTPLPPYIKREDEEGDVGRYQTVYANEPGSAAAPTAGLHFTGSLLERIRGMGVETVFVTLHVGLGTFRPVQTDKVEDHRMHEEYYHIGETARQRINLAKSEGRRVICVGTTSVRTIESACAADDNGHVYIPENKCAGSTEIFFYPGGRKFLVTDALITNFHLPKSTLLMLVSAFYDRDKVLDIYSEAIKERYRFFSYGDAMLIL